MDWIAEPFAEGGSPVTDEKANEWRAKGEPLYVQMPFAIETTDGAEDIGRKTLRALDACMELLNGSGATGEWWRRPQVNAMAGGLLRVSMARKFPPTEKP
jgi:hypothetical protein